MPIGAGLVDAGVLETTLPGSTVPISFIAERNLFDRPQIYGYDDDPYRFAFFSRAALDLAVAARVAARRRPCARLARRAGRAVAGHRGGADPRFAACPPCSPSTTCCTRDSAPRACSRISGFDAPPLVEEGLRARQLHGARDLPRHDGQHRQPDVRAGDHDAATAEGLDALLRHRHFDVHGILNGLDYDVWNPATDPQLASPVRRPSTLTDALANKRALQERLRAAERDDVPLVAMVTRLDAQKGIDIAGHAIHLLLNAIAGDAQFVVLGSGAPSYETMFAHLAALPSRQDGGGRRATTPELAPLIYGGSDLFLMPSLFEPCGLGQLIAMRYGSVPVVRQPGGLADTVHDGETGFSFVEYTPDALWQALARAVSTWWHDRSGFQRMQQRGMAQDFSWAASAGGYEQLFEWAISRERGW